MGPRHATYREKSPIQPSLLVAPLETGAPSGGWSKFLQRTGRARGVKAPGLLGKAANNPNDILEWKLITIFF